jgi:hypothetical protein
MQDRRERPERRQTYGRRAADQTIRTSAAVIASHAVTSASAGVLGAGLGAMALPVIEESFGGPLEAGQSAFLLSTLCLIVGLCVYLTLSAVHRRGLQKRAEALALAAAAQRAARPRVKDWSDILEERLDAYTVVFAEKHAKQEEALLNRYVERPDQADVPFEERPLPTAPEPAPPAPEPTRLDPELDSFADSAIEAFIGAELAPTACDAFALHLYLAGACGEITRRKGWDAALGQQALGRLLARAGTSAGYGQAFAANVNAWSHVTALRQALDAGRLAVAEGESGIHTTLAPVLATWRSQSGEIQPPEVQAFVMIAVTVTPRNGGDLEPEIHRGVMRSHKALVGALLTRAQGRVVQDVHTGLVVTFAETELAVRTAIAIQEQSEAWARAWDRLTISVRIALDADLALMIGDRCVSTAVRRGARILNTIGAGTIACTAAVRDGALQGETFALLRAQDDADDVPELFEIPWTAETVVDERPVEYTHIGSDRGESLAAARKTQALDTWLAARGRRQP